uniref:Uncharacterized protein n=1 Tax=Rhizophora mucronata TaxID=61149 RepID=A0A2P2IHH9_RHIMU
MYLELPRQFRELLFSHCWSLICDPFMGLTYLFKLLGGMVS